MKTNPEGNPIAEIAGETVVCTKLKVTPRTITSRDRGPVTLACQRSERNIWDAMQELEYDRARYKRALEQIGFRLAGTEFDSISQRTLAVFQGDTLDGFPIQAHHVGW